MDDEEFEVVDALPVVVDDEFRVIEPIRPTAVPAVQAAALAATGFVAGAATVAVVSRRRAAKPAKKRRKGKNGLVADVVSSNSFLVDVHLLKRK